MALEKTLKRRGYVGIPVVPGVAGIELGNTLRQYASGIIYTGGKMFVRRKNVPRHLLRQLITK